MSDLMIGGDRVRVALAPAEGGRVAQMTVDGTDLLVGRGEGPEPSSPLAWGSYPMVPWAGRIRHGRFRFDGAQHSLPVNFGAHAIHGFGFDAAWDVVASSADGAEFVLALPEDDRWRFGGTARQRFDVSSNGLRMELSVTAGARAMPAAVGWHPWFRKPRRLAFEPEAMYRRDDDHIAVDELVEVPDDPWDDCFVNRGPVGLTIGDIELQLTSNCTDWVIYDMPAHATCVEPQTAPPDAFNVRPNRLEPGDTLTAWYLLTAAP